MTNKIFNQAVEYLAGLSEAFRGFTDGIGGINVTLIAWEWWLVFFMAFVIFLSGFSYGKTRLFISMLAIYAAAFIEPLFVYLDKVSGLIEAEIYVTRIILFFVIYFTAFAIFNASSLKARFTLKEYGLFPILIFALVKFGFLTSVILNYLPQGVTESGSLKLLGSYFASPAARFWWAVLPLFAALLLVKGKKNE